jgi:DNA topoisomerase I
MIKNLVIVESPAKAKTIEGFLGKDFLVKSSFGHVRDLPKTSIGIEIEKDFTPLYEISSDKKTVINDLKKHADKARLFGLPLTRTAKEKPFLGIWPKP